MDAVNHDTVNVTLRRRIAAYSNPTAEDLASDIHTLEQRIASDRGAWTTFERRIYELQSRGIPAEATLPSAASA